MILLNVSLARAFGKEDSYAVGLILLPIVFYPILGFGKDEFKGANPMADFIFKNNNTSSNANSNVNTGANPSENPNTGIETNINPVVNVDNNSNDSESSDTQNIEVLDENQSKKYCSSCGTQIDTDTKFCPNCGSQLN